MTGPEQASPDHEPTQEERAIETINAIFSGGNLTEEAMRLSNEFTDRQSLRISKWLGRSSDAEVARRFLVDEVGDPERSDPR